MDQKYNVLHRLTSSPFIIENEVDTDHLDNSRACGFISVGVCRSKLPVSTFKMSKGTVFKRVLVTMT